LNRSLLRAYLKRIIFSFSIKENAIFYKKGSKLSKKIAAKSKAQQTKLIE